MVILVVLLLCLLCHDWRSHLCNVGASCSRMLDTCHGVSLAHDSRMNVSNHLIESTLFEALVEYRAGGPGREESCYGEDDLIYDGTGAYVQDCDSVCYFVINPSPDRRGIFSEISCSEELVWTVNLFVEAEPIREHCCGREMAIRTHDGPKVSLNVYARYLVLITMFPGSTGLNRSPGLKAAPASHDRGKPELQGTDRNSVFTSTWQEHRSVGCFMIGS